MKAAYNRLSAPLSQGEWDDEDVDRYLDAIEGTCDASMRKARPFLRRRSGPDVIWTPELTALRKAANSRRRLRQRAHRKPPHIREMREREYREATSALSKALSRAWVEAWEGFCTKLEGNQGPQVEPPPPRVSPKT